MEWTVAVTTGSWQQNFIVLDVLVLKIKENFRNRLVSSTNHTNHKVDGDVWLSAEEGIKN